MRRGRGALVWTRTDSRTTGRFESDFRQVQLRVLRDGPDQGGLTVADLAVQVSDAVGVAGLLASSCPDPLSSHSPESVRVAQQPDHVRPHGGFDGIGINHVA
jgi:hypothetical protein